MGKKKHSKQNSSLTKRTQHPFIYAIPLLLLTLIYPFLAQYNQVSNPLQDIPAYYQTETLSDIFLYIKAEFLIFIAISMLGIFIYNAITNVRNLHIKDYLVFLPLGVYAVFILLSTIFAQNKDLALSGMPGLFENIWTLLSYLVVCIFGYWYITNAEKKSSLVYALLASSLIMGIVFLLQFAGIDPYIALFEPYNATLAVEGVYGGFFNPNYLGSYVDLILPLLVTLLIAFRDNKKIALLFGIAIILTILGLIGSKTSGGLIGLAAVLGFAMLFLLFKKIHLSAGKFFVTIAVLILLAVGAVIGFLNHAGSSGQFLYQPLEAIYTRDDHLELHRNGQVFYITTEYTDTDFQVTCVNENGETLEPNLENGTYLYPYFALKPYSLAEAANVRVFGLTCDTTTWFFTNDTGDGTYYYITSAGDFAKSTNESIYSLPILHKQLDAIYTYDYYIELHYGNEVFYLNTQHSPTYFQVTCVNEKDEVITPILENGVYVYPFFTIKPYIFPEMDNMIAFKLTYGQKSWFFTNDTEDGTYYYIAASEGFAKITAENAPSSMLLTDIPRFMTGRGYIWSQSIPMLADTLFIGYGPDNFGAQFPNHNFIEALRGGFSDTYISKPHNMYLQMAIQTGLPSLLAFAVFYLIYFLKSVQLYLVSDLNSKHTLTGFGIFLGTLGYLIVGLVNDSSITVAPFFWLLMGIGYGMNQIIKMN